MIELRDHRANHRKGNETDQAIPIAEELARIVVAAEAVGEPPGDPTEERHAEASRAPEAPGAQRDRNEIENEEKKLIAGGIIDVAHQQEHSETENDRLHSINLPIQDA